MTTKSQQQTGLELFGEYHQFTSKLEAAAKKLASIKDGDVEIATTPKEKIHQIDKTVLYRYTPLVKAKKAAPVLIVYGLIGRQTMTDLQENRSLVRNLLEKGLDVYIVDWGNPTRADRWQTIDDYVDDYIDECVDVIRQQAGIEQLTMMGICEGGTFATCYAALYPEKIDHLILAITPIDFHADKQENRVDHGFINLWARSLDSQTIDKLIEVNGSMPGELMSFVFQMMTPIRSLTKYNIDLVDIACDEKKLINFLRMEKWIADRPDHPGEAAKQWFKDFYQANKLIKNEITINEKTVDLKNITMPVLNIFALEDHIIPPACSSALEHYVGSKTYTNLPLSGGHVGVFVSGKSQSILAPSIIEWLESND